MEVLFRPADQHDVHRGDGKRERFRVCFAVVNRRCRAGSRPGVREWCRLERGGGPDQRGPEPGSGPAPQPVDRATDRQRRDHRAVRPVHRRAHAGHPGLPLGDRRGPAPLAHRAQRRRVASRPASPPGRPRPAAPSRRIRRRAAGGRRPGRCRAARPVARPRRRTPGGRRRARRAARSPRSRRAASASTSADCSSIVVERSTRRCDPTPRAGRRAGTGPARPGRRARAPRARPRGGARSAARSRWRPRGRRGVAGPCSASASRIAADLSMTPTPLRLSIYQECYLRY